MKQAKVINFFGAPGAGKSTEAARLYVALKDRGVNVELVREVAKDYAWGTGFEIPNRVPYYLFSQQAKLQEVLRHKVDVIVTDSPLLLAPLYYDGVVVPIDEYEFTCKYVFESFDNINFFIPRGKPYNPAGRTQTSEESFDVEKKLLDLLERWNIKFHNISSTNTPTGTQIAQILNSN